MSKYSVLPPIIKYISIRFMILPKPPWLKPCIRPWLRNYKTFKIDNEAEWLFFILYFPGHLIFFRTFVSSRGYYIVRLRKRFNLCSNSPWIIYFINCFLQKINFLLTSKIFFFIYVFLFCATRKKILPPVECIMYFVITFVFRLP